MSLAACTYYSLYLGLCNFVKVASLRYGIYAQ